MIRTIPKIALLVGALAVAGQASAHGGGWVGPALLGGVIGGAIVGSVVSNSRPVYVQQPVYAQPAPVYVQQPAPVYYQPAPVYVQAPPPVVVYGGGGYYRPAYYGHPHYGYGPRW
ncbi:MULTISPECIES: hypothetical protein [Pseudomonas]|uniref:PXPV repeat-containing protein n=2 Tax=Pseudomonas gingeri TaxID=117681 RepID=A0A7Y7XWB3_9PSED|nr:MULTISPECIES: hypothetical protein [Pseudomonas]NVZ29234.1 hypothetical protein [Pseudomonas gingeri]NVZ64820.1 hypothetical protein [Pseudomonas gingeri]NVZ77047.1 hypothetical protein [Pseudomonas gingeri]NWA03413.1 hypothetical protein [Pseudomonas gingeri]NWA08929.1 hypothetical protein [Pseudomonas gingeri]